MNAAIAGKTEEIPLQSRIGIYAAFFFLTEMVGVVLPFLNVYLHKSGWNYEDIGVAAAMSGLGTLLLQIPVGIISDETVRRRLLLGGACVIFGVSYILLPVFVGSPWVIKGLLFLSGGMNAFFVPLSAAILLSIAGQRGFARMMGTGQGWSHAGNIAAAGTAVITVAYFGVTSVFFTLAGVCFFSMLSLCLILPESLHPIHQGEAGGATRLKSIFALFKDSRVVILTCSVAFFQIANAPAMPLAALYLQHLTGNESLTGWMVLIAQSTMVPVSLLGAWCAMRYGRKPVFAVAFIVLPLRLILFAMTQDPYGVIAVQALDGLCAGIYDVVICIICADLTRGKTGFSTLVCVMQTTVALGGFLGPLVQGWVTEHIGFGATFETLAAISVAGAVLFITKMPETKEKT